MKLKIFYSAFVSACFLFLIAGSSFFNQNAIAETEKENHIKFSHKLHQDLSSCQDCHIPATTASDLKGRLLPAKEKCAECHDVNDTDACGTCHTSDDYQPFTERKQSELVFNHAQHLEVGTDCQLCHAGIAENEQLTNFSNYDPGMATCNTCHSETKMASNACETCHLNTADLRPETHLTANFSRSHKFMAGSPTSDCMMCHDNNSCEECHSATTALDVTNSSNSFYTPYGGQALFSPRKLQKIQKAHELNYRFTHGMDAKNKSADCQSCHQVETFCGECHAGDNQDFALAGVIPTSHTQAGFIMLGVGSGGGTHATLAKRDIENCASCHDTQGADPACILCHSDADGIKNTNAKTHMKGFLSSTEGDWHEDASSICYTCHTDANARPNGIAGIGFCGYCHGAK